MRMGKRVVGMLIATGMAGASGAAAAEGIDVFKYAVSGGTPNLDLRLRSETSEQDNALEGAQALTARLRVGYTTARWNGFDAAAEFEGVAAAGDEEFNSRRNGETTYSVIADPTGNELNQSWVRYTGPAATALKFGRQRIVLDNGRHIGNAGWRQNEQTFDATLLTTGVLPKTTLSYARITDVNSIFFSDYRLHGDVLHVAVKPLEALSLSAYGYRLDFEGSAATVPGSLSAAQATDARTLGLRASGALPAGAVKVGYTLEYARQGATADSSIADTDYHLAELGATLAGFTLKAAYESLGADDGATRGFQTPLATLHAFQGWADMFLTTPATGLVESSLSLGYTRDALGVLVRGSQFDADTGALDDYGFELDAQLTYAINEQLGTGIKYANYDAHDLLVDTEKSWAWVEYKF